MIDPQKLVQQPPNTMPEIKSLYAFVAVDPEDGNEGVMSVTVHGMVMPLIAADEDRLASIRPIAAASARASGRTVKLVQFTERKEIETL